MRASGAALLATLAAGSLVVIAVGGNPSSHNARTHVRTAATATTRTHRSADRVATPTSSARTTTSTSAATTSTPVTPSTTAAPAAAPSTATRRAATPPPATAPLLVTRLAGIGAAQQVVTVVAGGYGSSIATVSAYQRRPSGWAQVFGPWSSYIGRNGVAPVGAKREGDGRTPSGVFGFDFMFGVNADPGTRYAYRRITGPNIVWDDDSTSPNYNEWVDDTKQSAGHNPEPMYTTPSYSYGVVFSYNDARTPGLGSAMFLHVTHSSPTSGCVSLPEGELLDVLRWLDPAQSPRIAIGTLASLTS